MSTQKQIQANRLNGCKGGVKTGAGKAAIRLNAVSHGLLSKEVLLPGEDGCRLAALRRQFMAELQPEGELENLLVERIVSSSWRLRRALRIEKTHTKRGGDYRYGDWEHCMRYETALERQIYKAFHELQSLQASRLANQAPAEPAEPDEPVEPAEPAGSAAEEDHPDPVENVSRELTSFFTKHSSLIYDQS